MMQVKRPFNILTFKQFCDNPPLAEIDGHWLPARPLRYSSMWNDLKLAWMVLTGKADVFVWPEDEAGIFEEPIIKEKS